ncbi:MAG TPA: hypothetical protein VN729_00645, partial [Ktedonobacteraceae bacterium]|nr:hypothetical protein [Ktedonobacteraceae bacterium]
VTSTHIHPRKKGHAPQARLLNGLACVETPINRILSSAQVSRNLAVYLNQSEKEQCIAINYRFYRYR